VAIHPIAAFTWAMGPMPSFQSLMYVQAFLEERPTITKAARNVPV
jgi:hypothetical protein